MFKVQTLVNVPVWHIGICTSTLVVVQ